MPNFLQLNGSDAARQKKGQDVYTKKFPRLFASLYCVLPGTNLYLAPFLYLFLAPFLYLFLASFLDNKMIVMWVPNALCSAPLASSRYFVRVARIHSVNTRSSSTGLKYYIPQYKTNRLQRSIHFIGVKI